MMVLQRMVGYDSECHYGTNSSVTDATEVSVSHCLKKINTYPHYSVSHY